MRIVVALLGIGIVGASSTFGAPLEDPARQVEALAAALGIDLAPPALDGRVRPDPRAVEALQSVRAALYDHLDRELQRTTPGSTPLPAGLAGYLEERREPLAALRQRLIAGEPPRWEGCNLLGQIQLQRLLLTQALARGSLAELEASWQLNAALREAPELISQFVAIAVARLQAGVLRRLDDVPAGWDERLLEHDYRESMLHALEQESRSLRQVGAAGAAELLEANRLQRTALRWSEPYVSWCLADLDTRFRRHLVRLAELDSLCPQEVRVLSERFVEELPWWNPLEALTTPLRGAIERVARLEIDIELTHKLLLLVAERRRHGGLWPAALAGLEDSTACTEFRWVYRVGADGRTMQLALDRELDWPGVSGLILPTRWSSATP